MPPPRSSPVRLAGALEVLLLEQPRRPGLDEDHVDRVAGGVVQVAGDAGALLGRGEAALALGLPLGAKGSLLELGDPRAPQADAVADHPCPAPDEGAEEERDGRELVLRDTGSAGVDRRRGRPRPEPSATSVRASARGSGRGSRARRSGRAGGRVGSRGRSARRSPRRSAAKTASGARRRATSGSEASAASSTPSGSRSRASAPESPREASIASERANTTAAIAASSRNSRRRTVAARSDFDACWDATFPASVASDRQARVSPGEDPASARGGTRSSFPGAFRSAGAGAYRGCMRTTRHPKERRP